MRLLVLSAAYPAPSEPQRAVFIENLTRLQYELMRGDGSPERRGGAEVLVVAPRVSRSDPREEVRGGVRVHRFSYPGGGRRLKEIAQPSHALLGAYAASCTRCLLRQVRSLRADCILCHWLLPTGPLAAFAAARSRIPFVVVVHGSDLNIYARSSRLGARLARFALRRAARVLAVSRPLAENLVDDFDVPASKVQCLSMGVDARLFTPLPLEAAAKERHAARQELGLDRKRPTVLFVGDLIAAKGVEELLAAWRALSARGIEAQLCLVGDGPLRQAGTSSPATESVRFVGRVAPPELLRWYRAADIFVLPSRTEGTPVSLMEALSCGVPAIASQVGGIPQVLEEEGAGRLVPPGDVNALTEALAEFTQNSAGLDRLRRRLGELPAARFSAERRARELGSVLEEVSSGS